MRFFFDRNMSPKLARMMAVLDDAHEIRSHYHDHRFARDEPDPSWLNTLGLDIPKWVVISADHRIVTTRANREALREADLTFFVLLAGWTHLKPLAQASKFMLIWEQLVARAAPQHPTIFEIPVRQPIIRVRGLTRDAG